MPTETGRHRLYEKVKTEWGEEHAAELMSNFPPVGWADVATKQDLESLRVATKQDFALHGAELRGEMSDIRAELRGGLAGLRVELHKTLNTQLRWILAAMVAMTGIFGTIVGLVR